MLCYNFGRFIRRSKVLVHGSQFTVPGKYIENPAIGFTVNCHPLTVNPLFKRT